MKIVHVIGAFIAGGAESFATEMAMQLHRLGEHVQLWALSNRSDDAGQKRRQRAESEGIVIEVGPSDKVGVGAFVWFLRLMRRERPDVIHLHTPNTELMYIIARRMANYRHEVFRTIHSTARDRRWPYAWARAQNDKAVSIACGSGVYEAWKHALAGRIYTVTNGVNFSWPIKTDEETVKSRMRLGLSAAGYYAVAIGRMNGTRVSELAKGLDVLIRAWRQARHKNDNAVLHICGNGNQLSALKALAGQDSGIVFLGVVDNVHDWLLASDIFVMPSRVEGLPLAAIEAAGTGVRCILSDIPPLRELKVMDALYIPVNDDAALARALQVAFGRRDTLDILWVTEFRKKYSIETTAREYWNLYMHRSPRGREQPCSTILD